MAIGQQIWEASNKGWQGVDGSTIQLLYPWLPSSFRMKVTLTPGTISMEKFLEFIVQKICHTAVLVPVCYQVLSYNCHTEAFWGCFYFRLARVS